MPYCRKVFKSSRKNANLFVIPKRDEILHDLFWIDFYSKLYIKNSDIENLKIQILFLGLS